MSAEPSVKASDAWRAPGRNEHEGKVSLGWFPKALFGHGMNTGLQV